MARIPLAEGREQITRQPLAARAGPGVFSTEVARATQEFAQVAARAAQQFEEAQTLAEKTNASTNALRGLKELNLEAESARTIEDINKFRTDYPNRISKIREESNKLISLPRAKSEFGRSFDRDKLTFDFSIRSTLQKNQNFALENILNENIIEQRDRFINGDVITGKIAEANRDLLLNDAVKRGVLNAKQTQEKRAKQAKEWRLAKIDVDIEGDAEFALAQLKLGEDGIYADTDAGDRLTKEKAAETKLKRNTEIAKKLLNEKHTKNELDLSQKYFTNELFVDDIQDQFISGDISQKYAGILNTILTTPKTIDARTDDAEMEKLVTAYYKLDESKLDDLREFRLKVLGKHAQSLLSRDDTEFFINKTVDPFTKKKEEAKGWIRAAIDWFRTSLAPKGEQAKMINKLLHRVDEKSSEEAIVKAREDIAVETTREVYPGYEPEDLEFTAQETGLSVKEVFDLLEKDRKRK